MFEKQVIWRFTNVNGLQLGNNALLGVNVGTVRGIEMINDTNIKVNMIIDNTIFKHIKKRCSSYYRF
jgi:phospholipid/cholesterol/gamma-HCH transport system substrate-binding protein